MTPRSKDRGVLRFQNFPPPPPWLLPPELRCTELPPPLLPEVFCCLRVLVTLLYRYRSRKVCRFHIIASGGVSSLEDVEALRNMDLYGCIIGKAYYTGAIDLRRAIEVAL